jgi:putative endonuclease
MKALRSTRERGADGESVAARYLEEQGFRILERNFRIRRGEVDIIAVRGEILAFCEVKTWRSLPMESLEHAISRDKRRRIVTTAAFFLSRNPSFRNHQARFDVLYVPAGGGRTEVCHIEGAFDGDGGW